MDAEKEKTDLKHESCPVNEFCWKCKESSNTFTFYLTFLSVKQGGVSETDLTLNVSRVQGHENKKTDQTAWHL